MSKNQSIDVVRKALTEFWSEGKVDLVKDIYSPKYKRNDAQAPGVSGHQGIVELVDIFREAIPDLRFTIIDETITAADNRVALHYWMEGTHENTLFNIAPTGRGFMISATSIFKVEDGKIVEDWHSYDMLTFFQALGAIPSMADHLEKKVD